MNSSRPSSGAYLRPRRGPSRSWFLVGASGQFFTSGVAAVLGVVLLSADVPRSLDSLLHFVLGLLLAVAVIVGLVGFYGLWRNYGSALGAVTFGFGLAAAIAYLIASTLMVASVVQIRCDYGLCSSPLDWAILPYIVTLILLGVSLILEGVCNIVSRHDFGNVSSAVGAGVLSIIGGAMVCSFILAFYGGMFVITLASTVGGIVFARARVPLAAAGPLWPGGPADLGPQLRVR